MEELVRPKEGFRVDKASDMTNKTYVLINYTKSDALKNSQGMPVSAPVTFQVPSEDMVIMNWTDKEGKTHKEEQRRIRFVPAYSSIFYDEQPVDDKTMIKGWILFKDGVLIVNPREKNLVKFLELCNWNEKNTLAGFSTKTATFKLHDAEEVAKKHNDVEKEKHAIKVLIYGMSYEELKGLAQTLYIKMYAGKSAQELQAELIALAERNPTKFEAEMNSVARKMKYFVMQSEEKGLITYESYSNSLKWKSGGTVIVSAPVGQDVMDYFIELCLNNSRYMDVYEKIKDAVTVKVPEVKGANIPLKEAKIGGGMTVESMLDMAKEKGLIEMNSAWIKIPGIGEDGKDKSFGPGKKAIEMIKESQEAIDFLETACK